jgi:hypothetical protein
MNMSSGTTGGKANMFWSPVEKCRGCRSKSAALVA